MLKIKLSAIGGWPAAGVSAVAIIFGLALYLNWLGRQQETCVPPAAHPSKNIPISTIVGQDAYEVRSQHEAILKVQSVELDTNPYKTWAFVVGAAPSQDMLEPAEEPFDKLLGLALDDPDPAVRLGGIEAAISLSDEDAFDLLQQAALGDDDPDNRLCAVSELEQMLKSGLGDSGQIRQLLKEAAIDPDARVAELSQLILHEQNGFHDEKPEVAEIEPTQWEDGMGEPVDGSETRMESFETIQQQALYDADPAVRLTGIEASIDHWGKEGFRVLSEAAIGDFDADNRLSAISVLEHILKSGLGDSQQIQELLRYASTDPDPRVAELSSLIIQELAE